MQIVAERGVICNPGATRSRTLGRRLCPVCGKLVAVKRRGRRVHGLGLAAGQLQIADSLTTVLVLHLLITAIAVDKLNVTTTLLVTRGSKDGVSAPCTRPAKPWVVRTLVRASANRCVGLGLRCHLSRPSLDLVHTNGGPSALR